MTSWSCRPRANPRHSWERITPELPRAPIRAPFATMAAMRPTCRSPESLISFQAEVMVSDMFVPVSPSGTGNTLSAFTVCWLVLSQVRPASVRLLRACPSKGRLRSFSRRVVSTLIGCILSRVAHTQACYVDVDLVDGHPQRLLDVVLHSVGHAVRHGRNARAVFDDHKDVDVDVVPVEPHRDALGRFLRNGQRQALRQVLRRQAHHAIGLQRGMVRDGRHGLRGYVYAAQCCRIFAHVRSLPPQIGVRPASRWPLSGSYAPVFPDPCPGTPTCRLRNSRPALSYQISHPRRALPCASMESAPILSRAPLIPAAK